MTPAAPDGTTRRARKPHAEPVQAKVRIRSFGDGTALPEAAIRLEPPVLDPC